MYREILGTCLRVYKGECTCMVPAASKVWPFKTCTLASSLFSISGTVSHILVWRAKSRGTSIAESPQWRRRRTHYSRRNLGLVNLDTAYRSVLVITSSVWLQGRITRVVLGFKTGLLLWTRGGLIDRTRRHVHCGGMLLLLLLLGGRGGRGDRFVAYRMISRSRLVAFRMGKRFVRGNLRYIASSVGRCTTSRIHRCTTSKGRLRDHGFQRRLYRLGGCMTTFWSDCRAPQWSNPLTTAAQESDGGTIG